MNDQGSTAKDTELCGYCHCSHFPSKSATSSQGHRTTTAQTPKVNRQHITRVWHCTHRGTPASEGRWRLECSSNKGRGRSQRSSTPTGYLWGNEMVHEGIQIRKYSLANHFRSEVLNGCQSFATSHWSPGSSVGNSRCSCRYTLCVSIALWSISWNQSANPRSCKYLLCFLLLDWTYDDTEPQKFSWLKLKMRTIRGHLADGAHRTSVRRHRLDLGSETKLWILVEELLFDDACLSKAIEHKNSWFTWMEVLDTLYHHFCFTGNSLGREPNTSQFFQPLTLQLLVVVAAAIHCGLYVYATGKKLTVMFSQDEYRGKICLSTVIDCITAEVTALINYTWCAASSLPPPMVLLRYNRRFSIPIGAPQSGLVLWYFIQRFILPFLSALLLWKGLSSIPSSTSIRSASISFQTLYLPPLSGILSMDRLLHWIGASC